MSTQEDRLLSTPYTEPNFTSTHSVVLPHPVETTFAVLADGTKMDRVVRLSSACAGFDILRTDAIVLPDPSKPLSESRVRMLPPAENRDEPGTLPRTTFHLQEKVNVLGPLYKQIVDIAGTQAWDEKKKQMLYESVSKQNGILIWKLREFEEVDAGGGNGKKGTRVKERIEGRAPKLIRKATEKLARKAHQYVEWRPLVTLPCHCRYSICCVSFFSLI